MKGLKQVFEKTFFQLLIVYLVYFILIGFGVLKPLFKIDLFGAVLGIFGCFITFKKKEFKLSKHIVWISLILVVLTRIIWYFYTNVPLGYDPGWYKFVIDFPFAEQWTKSVFPLFFSLIMFPLGKIFGSAFLVKWLPVLLSVVLCYVVYWFISKEFDQTSGIIVSVLYAFSYTMYKVFWYNYIKNLLGMILLLIVIYLWSSKKRWTFLILAGMLAGIHRPAALIFGVSYLIYFILGLFKKDFSKSKTEFIDGVIILVLMLVFNFDRIFPFIINMIPNIGSSIVTTPSGGGTFFKISSYWKYAFAYIPFAIIGLWFGRRKLKLVIPFIVSSCIVLLQFIFYNRIIIYFDFFVILFAAYGFNILFKRYGKKVFGLFIIFLILSGSIFYSSLSKDSALIPDSEFEYIQNLELPSDSILIGTHSHYSTWLKGYYEGDLIAPGLFDNNPWDKETWFGFWSNVSYRSELVSELNYSQVYIHEGINQPKYKWDSNCFSSYDDYLYKFIC